MKRHSSSPPGPYQVEVERLVQDTKCQAAMVLVVEGKKGSAFTLAGTITAERALVVIETIGSMVDELKKSAPPDGRTIVIGCEHAARPCPAPCGCLCARCAQLRYALANASR